MGEQKHLLEGFVFKRLLKEHAQSKCVVIEGTLRGEPAVLQIEKTNFDYKDLETIASKRIVATYCIEENNIYHNHFGILDNDESAPDVKLLLIHPATEVHIKKYNDQQLFYVSETPEFYATRVKPYIESFPPSRTQWVRNILEGKAEQDKVIHSVDGDDAGYVLLPDSKWDLKTPATIYLQAIVHRANLRSIRDLRGDHLSLLRGIRDDVRRIIPETYPGVLAHELRMYLHYQPSYYHLHVHVAHYKVEMGIACGHAHLLDDVINHLEMDPGYYERSTLFYFAKEVPGVWDAPQTEKETN